MELSYSDYIATPIGFRQRDLTVRQAYGDEYLRTRYAAIDSKVRELADKRIEVLESFAGPSARRALLDFGCGTGRVAAAAAARGWAACGCDIVPTPAAITVERAAMMRWDAVTYFDSLEHVVDPLATLRALPAQWVMISVPNAARWHSKDWFMGWRHRRPGEHLWHFDAHSLDSLFGKAGYAVVMHSHFEDEWRANAYQKEPNILSAVYRRIEV